MNLANNDGKDGKDEKMMTKEEVQIAIKDALKEEKKKEWQEEQERVEGKNQAEKIVEEKENRSDDEAVLSEYKCESEVDFFKELETSSEKSSFLMPTGRDWLKPSQMMGKILITEHNLREVYKALGAPIAMYTKASRQQKGLLTVVIKGVQATIANLDDIEKQVFTTHVERRWPLYAEVSWEIFQEKVDDPEIEDFEKNEHNPQTLFDERLECATDMGCYVSLGEDTRKKKKIK